MELWQNHGEKDHLSGDLSGRQTVFLLMAHLPSLRAKLITFRSQFMQTYFLSVPLANNYVQFLIDILNQLE